MSKQKLGRPTLDPNEDTVYVPIGSVAMTPEQAEAFERIAETLHGKANAVRFILDAVAGIVKKPKNKKENAA